MKGRVLILSSNEGHASLARAARKVLERDYEVEEWELSSRVGNALYRVIYRFTPSWFGIVWELGKRQEVRGLYEWYIDNWYDPRLKRRLERFDFDLVVTTHFGHLPVLASLIEEHGRRFGHINVVSDPVTVHPLIYAKLADYNVGFGDEFVKEGLKEGVERQRLVKIGWLVDEEFYQPLTERAREAAYRRWKLERERLTVVVCGGSEGSNAVLKMLPVLLTEEWSDRLQILLVAGSNRWLKRAVESGYDLLVRSKKKVPLMRVTGFTRRMADAIRIADVVVGKAGPNLLFESVAAKKPFIAITHIEGQESGNLDLVQNYKLGWVAEKRSEFKKVFREWMEEEEVRRKLEVSLAKMATYNRAGLKKFKTLADGLVRERQGF